MPGGHCRLRQVRNSVAFSLSLCEEKCSLLQCYNVNLLLLVWLYDLLSLLSTIDRYHQAAMCNKVYHIFKGYNNFKIPM